MIGIVVAVGLLLLIALAAREYHLMRERATLVATLEHLRAALDLTRTQLRRSTEELYVLENILQERNLLDDADLAEGRTRFIEDPRRRAAERKAMARKLKINPTQLAPDDTSDKVH